MKMCVSLYDAVDPIASLQGAIAQFRAMTGEPPEVVVMDQVSYLEIIQDEWFLDMVKFSGAEGRPMVLLAKLLGVAEIEVV